MKTRFLVFLVFLVFVVLGATALSVQAQGETKLISAKALDDHECRSDEWHFVINQVESEALAPREITVTWANGATENVGLEKFTGGVAHYSTSSNLDSRVAEATAWIYVGWSGEFNLSHGPCGASPTPTVEVPTVTPTATTVETPTTPVTPTVTATGTGTVVVPTPTVTTTPVEVVSPTPTPTEPPLGGETKQGAPWPWLLLALTPGVLFPLRKLAFKKTF